MSIGASLLRGVYRLSGVKKAFALPEEQLLKAIEKANRGRGFFMSTDHKAHYEKRMVNGFPCLIVRAESKPSQRAILFFFGGGMVIGPDKGDAAVLRKLCYGTGCDVWFPIYPLCTEHCITVSYDMAYACYRQMIALYSDGNVSTCGFSSGGALALGMAAHNNALGAPLSPPRHIVAVSPGEVPWNDEERACMQARSSRRGHRLCLHGKGRSAHAPRAGQCAGIHALPLAGRLFRRGGYPLLLQHGRGAVRRMAGV